VLRTPWKAFTDELTPTDAATVRVTTGRADQVTPTDQVTVRSGTTHQQEDTATVTDGISISRGISLTLTLADTSSTSDDISVRAQKPVIVISATGGNRQPAVQTRPPVSLQVRERQTRKPRRTRVTAAPVIRNDDEEAIALLLLTDI
jgi:hypothetical protein